jgi:hypothetical protein
MNPPSDEATPDDLAWGLIFAFTLISSVLACMILSAVYVEPALLRIAASAPVDRLDKAIEPACLFGGMFAGFALALAIISALSRSFVRLDMYERWERRFLARRSELMPHVRWVQAVFLRATCPPDYLRKNQ